MITFGVPDTFILSGATVYLLPCPEALRAHPPGRRANEVMGLEVQEYSGTAEG